MIEFIVEKEDSGMKLYKITYNVEGVMVAWLFMYTVKLPSRNLGVIEEVNTLITHRRKGYATLLIKTAIQKANSLGLHCLELTVRQDAPEIQEFYKSLGFFDRKNHAYRLMLKG